MINMKTFYPFSLHCIKMEQKVLIFGKICLSKIFFHKRKHLIYIEKVDIDWILISSKKKGSFKYFIGYMNSYMKPICKKFSQMNGYVNYFNDNKFMNLLALNYYKNTMRYGIRYLIC